MTKQKTPTTPVIEVTPLHFEMRTDIRFQLYELDDPRNDIPWIFTGKFCALDNFFQWPVTVDVGWGEITYETSEHAFAAAKASTRKRHDLIAKSKGPGSAKAMGRATVTTLRPDWEQVKFQIMLTIVRAKMDQCIAAREVLLSTGDRTIYEGNTWFDDTWGVITGDGSAWSLNSVFRGRNALGAILMMIREELKNK